MKPIVISTLLLASGCAAEQPLTLADLTLAEMLRNQTTTYSNQNGDVAHHVECINPANCLLMSGVLCPHGYWQSGMHVQDHTDVSASRMDRYTSTSFEIVCKP
jgi:hypothetical protein